MTVYVIQQPAPNKTGWMPDFSSAAEYGAIQYLFNADERVYALGGPSLFKVRKFLRDTFKPEKDYILWPNIGDPMACIIAMLAIGEMGYDSIKCLYWNRKRDAQGNRDSQAGFYFPIQINLKERKDYGDDLDVDRFIQDGER